MALDLSANTASKLEPFLLMSKSAKGAAAAKLIMDATAAPGVFVFSELLEMPNIQELSKSEQAPYLTLLQVFAHGTLEDYNNVKQTATLPDLNDAQRTKLRLLTIVSLTLDHRILPYELLLRTLQVPTIRELEDLIIDGIYLDIMRGKLDQKEQQFEVECTIGRDLGPGKLEILLNSLQDWARTTSAVLSTLDAQLAQLASQGMAKRLEREEHERAVQATLSDVRKESKASGRTARGSMYDRERGDGEAMDVDEPRGSSGSVDAAKGRKFKLQDYGKTTARKRNRF
ncbi:uncharacterized protein FOMMEDRAFT_107333 [Fomitiporia mediterranea MF3/22]|uniref:uncharacterized protein n=1 Tax=Fomitiporia mediterranea (strain MF3/22) TaxID=694068 RepID=UPI0004407513|nr:uncharacterized protein FOMMEDRAFT_107333 [Fomitiporia mediterranea MF3/22]EJD04549.1 hypothetical protein FOMMEDRAFT_107333 [Fomitiporia mediterranea MF3/22]